MLKDLRTIPHGEVLNADIVVIGSGIAGLTIARELAEDGKQVIVLECGDQECTEYTDRFSEGIVNIVWPNGELNSENAYLNESRQLSLGGAANLWGGKCAIMDPIDFAARSYMPMSGWPVDFETLLPYFEKACRDMQIPTLTKAENWQAADAFSINNRNNFEPSIRTFTPFVGETKGGRYHGFKHDIAEHANISLYLNARVTELVLADAAHNDIECVLVSTPEGAVTRVEAKTFVLAAGGLENVRLLLASNRIKPEGVANEQGLVGKYFCGHAIFRLPGNQHHSQAGMYIHRDKDTPEMLEYVDKNSSAPHKLFKISEFAQRRKKLPNGTITLEQRIEGDTHVSYPAFFMFEQQLTPDSKVELVDKNDANSQLKLTWTFSKADVDNLKKMLELFDKDLKKSGLGGVDFVFDEEKLFKHMSLASHHMGTTRMSDDPAKGVVDGNCKVHNANNFYIASTSVFCTSGLANPTITLLALAHRICDHIRQAE